MYVGSAPTPGVNTHRLEPGSGNPMSDAAPGRVRERRTARTGNRPARASGASGRAANAVSSPAAGAPLIPSPSCGVTLKRMARTGACSRPACRAGAGGRAGAAVPITPPPACSAAHPALAPAGRFPATVRGDHGAPQQPPQEAVTAEQLTRCTATWKATCRAGRGMRHRTSFYGSSAAISCCRKRQTLRTRTRAETVIH